MLKEILADALPIIEKFAPAIGSALGSPLAGSAMGWVVNLLASSFGVDMANIKNLPAAILQDEQAGEKLTELEYTWGSFLKEHGKYFQLKLPQKAELNIKVEWAS